MSGKKIPVSKPKAKPAARKKKPVPSAVEPNVASAPDVENPALPALSGIVKIKGTGKSKSMPAGIEYKVTAEMAQLLISKGAATLA